MKKIEILPIGSGSGGNSCLIHINNYYLLIDMGLSCSKIKAALNKNDIVFQDIDAVFITHTHSDHIKGYKVLSKHLEAPFYASATTLKHLKAENGHSIKYRSRQEIMCDLYVTMLKTSHDCPGSACFIFESGNIKVSYVTDLGIMEIHIEEAMKGSDLAIIEANHDETMLRTGPYPYYLKQRILSYEGHLSNDRCADTIKILYRFGTKHFLLAHLSKENNKPELALEEVRKLGLDVDVKALAVQSDEMLRYELED